MKVFDARDPLQVGNQQVPGNRQGGFFWSPGLGLKFSSRKKHAVLIHMAYRQQATTLESPFGNGTSITKNTFNRVLFRMGLSF